MGSKEFFMIKEVFEEIFSTSFTALRFSFRETTEILLEKNVAAYLPVSCIRQPLQGKFYLRQKFRHDFRTTPYFIINTVLDKENNGRGQWIAFRATILF